MDSPAQDGKVADRRCDRGDAVEQGVAEGLDGKAEPEQVQSMDRIGTRIDPFRIGHPFLKC